MTSPATASVLPPGLAEKLRQVHGLVAPVRNRVRSAERVAELLERDLLPRTAGGDAYVVCGIVGPNNAGKSALFNALLGRELSPSVPAGGATRRLVGAASPDLLSSLTAEPTLARFLLRPVAEPSGCLKEALAPAENPAELLIVADKHMPAGLMLIDTPDFDSILADNRLASESLLTVADVVLAVVTRHSYQNREVVSFLERWFDHGRPWLLVYNEALDEDIARSHAAKLIDQLGQPPLAVFWAPHSFPVQEGREPLVPCRLLLDGEDVKGGVKAGMADAPDLRTELFDVERISHVKSRAFVAALARLRDGLRSLIAALESETEAARELLAAADDHTRRAGERIASSAMPAGPFVEAFRTVLDRRSNPLSRSWRTGLRTVRLQFEGLVAALRGKSVQDANAPEMVSLTDIEIAALRRRWPVFWEELARDLGTEARHPARQECGVDLAALLSGELVEAHRNRALEGAATALKERAAELSAFREECGTLIDHALQERGFDLDIQALADVVTLAPLAVAAAIVVKTGGLGVDLAVAGGGAVSSFLMEKYSHLLGSGILAAARRRWEILRGARIGEVLLEACLPRSALAMRTATDRDVSLVEALRSVTTELSATDGTGFGQP